MGCYVTMSFVSYSDIRVEKLASQPEEFLWKFYVGGLVFKKKL